MRLTAFGFKTNILYCLTSHTLHREEGSGHASTIELSPWNAWNHLTQWSDNKMLTSAKHVVL